MTNLQQSTRLGDVLVERKVITRSQLHQAIELQQHRREQALQTDSPDVHELGEVLIELGFITRAQLKTGLGWQRRLRKATAAMVFVAPLFTAACGGGGGSGNNGAGSGAGGTSSLHSNSQTIDQSAPAYTSSAGSQLFPSSPVPEPVVEPVTSSLSSSLSNVSSFPASSSSLTPVSPVGLSSSLSLSSFSSSLLGGLSSSSSTVRNSSSSSAPALPSSSRASSAAASAVNEQVHIYWNAPTQRENGEYLDIREIGGYELRYKRPSDVYYSKIVIKDAYTDAYFFDYLQGEYEFHIAAFDTDGLYSAFVPVKPNR